MIALKSIWNYSTLIEHESLYFVLDYNLFKEKSDCDIKTKLHIFKGDESNIDVCSEMCRKSSSGYFVFGCKFGDGDCTCTCQKQCDNITTNPFVNVYAYKGISKTCYDIMLVSKVYLKSLIFILVWSNH